MFFWPRPELPTAATGDGIYIYDTEGRRYIAGFLHSIKPGLERIEGERSAKEVTDKFRCRFRTAW